MDSLLPVFVFLKILERKSDHLLLVLKGSAKRKMRKDSKVLFSLTNKSKQTFILNLEQESYLQNACLFLIKTIPCLGLYSNSSTMHVGLASVVLMEYILSEVSAWQVWQNKISRIIIHCHQGLSYSSKVYFPFLCQNKIVLIQQKRKRCVA